MKFLPYRWLVLIAALAAGAVYLVQARDQSTPQATQNPDVLRAALVAVLPLQPVTATATRDMVLAAAKPADLAEWLRDCSAQMPDGAPGCVLVVADLWTDYPGEEAMLLRRVGADQVVIEGLLPDKGALQRRQVLAVGGIMPDLAQGSALIAALQKAPPAMSAAPVNRISVGDLGLMVAP